MDCGNLYGYSWSIREHERQNWSAKLADVLLSCWRCVESIVSWRSCAERALIATNGRTGTLSGKWPRNSRPAGDARRQADSFWRPRRFICHTARQSGRRWRGALLAHYDRPGWPWRVIGDTAWRHSSNRTTSTTFHLMADSASSGSIIITIFISHAASDARHELMCRGVIFRTF